MNTPYPRPAAPLLALIAAALPANPALAGPQPTYTVLLREDDPFPDFGTLSSFNHMAINDAGDWLVWAESSSGEGIIRSGALVIENGDAVEPAPAIMATVDSLSINAAGDGCWRLNLANVPTETDQGIYIDSGLLLRRGDPLQALHFGPGSTYTELRFAKINDNRQVLLLGVAEDPTTPESLEHFAILLQADASGNLVSQTALHRDGLDVDGRGELEVIWSGQHTFAVNSTGGYVMNVTLDSPTLGSRPALIVSGQVALFSGDDSPIPGRPWSSVGGTSRNCHINNLGEFICTATIQGDSATNAVLVKNGQIIKQEGTTFPAIEPAVLTTGFTGSPVYISDAGEAIWYGIWSDGATSGSGLLVDDTIIFQRSVTTVDGQLVTNALTGSHGFAASPSGRYIVVSCELDGTGALVLIDRGDQATPCPPDWNNDDAVNSNDISAFLTAWLDSVTMGNLTADFNNDESVNSNDISAFLTAWLDAVQNGC